MSSIEMEIPPLAIAPSPRGASLGPVCNILLDAAEELHGMEGTAWWDEPYTLAEREMTLLAVAALSR